MLELRILNAGQSLPLFDLPAFLGRREAARELSDTIEGLISFLDDLGGDPDLEDGNDDELTGDECESSFPEGWSNGPFIMARGSLGARALADENAEDDDSDRCAAGDDTIDSGPVVDLYGGIYPGRPGDDEDAEEAYPEWHTRGRHKLDRDGAEPSRGLNGWSVREDTEDDDQDACTALDDDPARIVGDGQPGDAFDTELNGDETDHQEDPYS